MITFSLVKNGRGLIVAPRAILSLWWGEGQNDTDFLGASQVLRPRDEIRLTHLPSRITHSSFPSTCLLLLWSCFVLMGCLGSCRVGQRLVQVRMGA